MGDKWVHIFLKGISLLVDVIEQQKLGLVYFKAVVQYLNTYAMRTSPVKQYQRTEPHVHASNELLLTSNSTYPKLYVCQSEDFKKVNRIIFWKYSLFGLLF